MQEDALDNTLKLLSSILGTRDVNPLLKRITDSVTGDFGFDGCDVFLLNDEKNAFVLKMTKGYPTIVAERVDNYRKSVDEVRDQLSQAERLGRFTYLYKATLTEDPKEYYGLMHPEKVGLPREHTDDWHELDALYVTFEDSAGDLIGFMEPDAPRSGKLPSPSLIVNMDIFANIASIAISNASLLENLDKAVKNYKALLETTAILQEPVDITDTLKTIAHKLNELVPFDEISVYLVDWEQNRLIPVFATGPYAEDVMTDIGPINGLAGTVARSGKTELVEDSTKDDRLEDIAGMEDIEIPQAIMAIPLKGKRGVEGVLELYRDSARKFTGLEWEIVEPFAAHAAIAMENARLRQELKENFESVQNSYVEMKNLDRMKDSLVDTISHELRTPLTTVMGYLEMASVGMYGEVTPKMMEKFEAMLESVRRVNQLVAAMLELSRIQKESMKLEMGPVNIAMVTKEVVREWDEEIKKRRHRVVVLFGNDLPIVQCDRLRIYDVIGNMVSNALKYTDDGGQITIGADILGGKMHLWVKDSGIGISEEDKGRIFDKFFLAEAGLLRADNRLGIGLHISREIIRRHGGEMWFESKKDAGSTFHFSIPLKQAKMGSA